MVQEKNSVTYSLAASSFRFRDRIIKRWKEICLLNRITSSSRNIWTASIRIMVNEKNTKWEYTKIVMTEEWGGELTCIVP